METQSFVPWLLLTYIRTYVAVGNIIIVESLAMKVQECFLYNFYLQVLLQEIFVGKNITDNLLVSGLYRTQPSWLLTGLLLNVRWHGRGICLVSSANRILLLLEKWLAPCLPLGNYTCQKLKKLPTTYKSWNKSQYLHVPL